eukprot:1236661-Heterocapsa_arctica.AAC.1
MGTRASWQRHGCCEQSTRRDEHRGGWHLRQVLRQQQQHCYLKLKRCAEPMGSRCPGRGD